METWKKTVAKFMISQTVSLLGSMLVMYAIMWYVTLSTQSGVMMTIMVLCSSIPALIISPFAGVWADKLNRKMLMITADLVIAAVTLIIAILFFFDIREVWIIFIVSIIRSFGQSVHQPAVSAVYTQIVPKDKLIKVQGIAQGIQSSSMVLMPLLAGLLMVLFPLEYIMFIDIVTAVLAVTMLIFFVKLPKHQAEINHEGIEYFKDIKEGLSYAFKHSFVFYLILFGFLFMIVVAAPAFLSYLQVARVFGAEPWRLSLLEALFGIGMLLGSLIVSIWGGFKNRLFTYFLAYIMIGVGTIGLGVPFNFWFYIGFWAWVGTFIAVSNPIIVGLIQEKVEAKYIGRVFSVFGLIHTVSLPLGMLVFGPLSDYVDVSHIILVSGILMVVIAVIPLFNRKLLKQGIVVKAESESITKQPQLTEI